MRSATRLYYHRGKVGGIQVHGTRQISWISGSDEHLRRWGPLAAVGTNSGSHSPNLLQDRIHLLFVLLLVLTIQAPWCPSVVSAAVVLLGVRGVQEQDGPLATSGGAHGVTPRLAQGLHHLFIHLALVTSCTTTSTMWSRSGSRPETEVTLAGS
jgi:hypothetical protein